MNANELKLTDKQLIAGFTEWERRYREEPSRFQSDSERLAESPDSYGAACVPYLLQIIEELTGAPA